MGEDEIVVLCREIVEEIENVLRDVIVLRKDGGVYGGCLEEMGNGYWLGMESNEEGVVYGEGCGEG